MVEIHPQRSNPYVTTTSDVYEGGVRQVLSAVKHYTPLNPRGTGANG